MKHALESLALTFTTGTASFLILTLIFRLCCELEPLSEWKDWLGAYIGFLGFGLFFGAIYFAFGPVE